MTVNTRRREYDRTGLYRRRARGEDTEGDQQQQQQQQSPISVNGDLFRQVPQDPTTEAESQPPEGDTATNREEEEAAAADHDGNHEDENEYEDDVDDVDDDDDELDMEEEEIRKRNERRARIGAFLKTFSVYTLLDPSRPWILAQNGSFAGYFDWVPAELRVGPWSTLAIFYLTALYYTLAMTVGYYSSSVSRPWWTIEFVETLEYPAVGSLGWCYHVGGFLWMLIICSLILNGPFTYVAWGTYTVQSWTLMMLRHGLCALAPIYPWALNMAEYIRFPVACSASVTFFVWNFLLFPVIYFFAMKTAEQKSGFLKFCTSFRLSNIHLLNIVLCILNVKVFSPARTLQGIDLVLAMVSMATYMGWYLGVLDRLGVHMYPIFSPRKGALVLFAWTFALLCYVVSYHVWRTLLAR